MMIHQGSLPESGLCFLEDLGSAVDCQRVIRHYRTIEYAGRIPWHEIGVCRRWRRWVVKVEVFKSYYRRHFANKG